MYINNMSIISSEDYDTPQTVHTPIEETGNVLNLILPLESTLLHDELLLTTRKTLQSCECALTVCVGLLWVVEKAAPSVVVLPVCPVSVWWICTVHSDNSTKHSSKGTTCGSVQVFPYRPKERASVSSFVHSDSHQVCPVHLISLLGSPPMNLL